MQDAQNAFLLASPVSKGALHTGSFKNNKSDGMVKDGHDNALMSFMALLNQIAGRTSDKSEISQSPDLRFPTAREQTSEENKAGLLLGGSDVRMFSKSILDLVASIKIDFEENGVDAAALSEEMSGVLSEIGHDTSDWDLRAVEAMLSKLRDRYMKQAANLKSDGLQSIDDKTSHPGHLILGLDAPLTGSADEEAPEENPGEAEQLSISPLLSRYAFSEDGQIGEKTTATRPQPLFALHSYLEPDTSKETAETAGQGAPVTGQPYKAASADDIDAKDVKLTKAEVIPVDVTSSQDAKLLDVQTDKDVPAGLKATNVTETKAEVIPVDVTSSQDAKPLVVQTDKDVPADLNVTGVKKTKAEVMPVDVTSLKDVKPLDKQTDKNAPVDVKAINLETVSVKAASIQDVKPLDNLADKNAPVDAKATNVEAAIDKTMSVKVVPVEVTYVQDEKSPEEQTDKNSPVDEKATNIKATNVVATNNMATDVMATDVIATNVITTNVITTNVVATDVEATNVIATNVEASPVKAAQSETTLVRDAKSINKQTDKNTPVDEKTTDANADNVKAKPLKEKSLQVPDPLDTQTDKNAPAYDRTTNARKTNVDATDVEAAYVETIPTKATYVKSTPAKPTNVTAEPAGAFTVETTHVRATLVEATNVEVTSLHARSKLTNEFSSGSSESGLGDERSQGEKTDSDDRRRDLPARFAQQMTVGLDKDFVESKSRTNFTENKAVFEKFFESVMAQRSASGPGTTSTPGLELAKGSPFSQGQALHDGLNNVVRFIRVSGEQKASLIVDPPGLGRIGVELTSTATGIEASIKVSSEQIRQLIQAHLTQLKLSLEQQEVQLTHFSVDVQQDDGRKNREQWNTRRRSALAAGREAVEEEEALFQVDLNQGLLYWVA